MNYLYTNKITFYPNPTSNILHIKLNNLEADKAILYDLSRKQILDIELKTNITIADISKLNSGIYILKIKTTNNLFVKRIVKK
ncbi:T9SS type A sorting domain-containing protein [Algibacter luteus]|uniref:T9SS type A sorting domain-containing protein n=1 Tax=Algibacter luteus TaxID=1178825 RepID=UPI0009DA0A93